MANLAQTHISVTDESAYASGIGEKIPLYIIATEQDKVINNVTKKIADGTKKENANQLYILSSRSEMVDTFGTPSFEYKTTENDVIIQNSVNQGSECNEYGLFGVYQGLGNTSTAYVVRADIDLEQLKSTSNLPQGKAKNNQLWLDLTNSSFGIFRNNGNSRLALAWEKVSDLFFISEEDELTEENGYLGQIAVLAGSSGSMTFFEKCETAWLKIGSNEWCNADGKTRDVSISKHTRIPENKTQGSLWFKTTSPNNGLNLILKQYHTTTDSWTTVLCPSYQSIVDIDDTSKYFVICQNVDGVVLSLYKYNATKQLSLEISDTTSDKLFVSHNSIIEFNTITDFTNKVTNGENDTNTKHTDFIATKTVDGMKITSVNGLPFGIQIITDSDSSSNTTADDVIEIGFENAIELNVIQSTTTPQGEVEDGTLLYQGVESFYETDTNNLVFENTGEMWKEVDIVSLNVNEPDTKEDNALWMYLNQNEQLVVKRLFNEEWEVVDTSDNSSPLGIIFDDVYKANPKSYPQGMILVNINQLNGCVKEYKNHSWVNASGLDFNGSCLFGRNAQRAMVVKALQQAVNSCEDLESLEYDFFYATCPGYPELDTAINSLNTNKKTIFYNVSDTPSRLEPKGTDIINWASNKNNTTVHGTDGRVSTSAYQTRQYPPMCLMSNIDGRSVAVPSSIEIMNKILSTPSGKIAAGSQYGVLSEVSSVGYINEENEFTPVSINDSLGQILTSQNINPLMLRRGTGLLRWGEITENNYESSLSREHGVITLLQLKRDLEEAVQPFFFKLNVQSVRRDFDNILRSVLNKYVDSEQIYDYVLDTSDSVNTNETIGRNELHADIAIYITNGIEQIYLPIRILAVGSM